MTRGIIHSIDPIVSERAYAKAVFGNRDVIVEARGKRLYFETNDDISDLIGDTNVEILN